MIQTELVDNDTRIHHYSDSNFKIRQVETGIIYYTAVDVLPCKYTYEETDEVIEEPEESKQPEESENND